VEDTLPVFAASFDFASRADSLSKNANGEKELMPYTWNDDVLDRAKIAETLTGLLTESTARHASRRSSGLTVALDAGWGAGKSFFVSHWAKELRDAGYPVVTFDAWENDVGDEASVALMARIRGELQTWCKRLPAETALQEKAREFISRAVGDIRKALIPAARVAATSALKKATGIATDELLEAISSATNKSMDLKDGASSAVEAGLDEYFSKAMEAHEARTKSIQEFKSSISGSLQLIHQGAGARLPMFVFVDEVDRCRPSYALRLLEEIKHIFGAQDTCFVVSTNLSQLKEAVGAVYGANFDGHGYLTRFFDEFFTLPDPDNRSYARLLWEDSPVLAQRAVVTGLPKSGNTDTPESAIALVFEALNVDLRSQRQVFAIANSVAAAIPHDKNIFVLWLFFLSALRHKNPTLFGRLRSHPDDHNVFNAICEQAFARSVLIEHDKPRSRSFHESPTTTTTKLVDVLWAYNHWSHADLEKVWESWNSDRTHSYPQTNSLEIANELPSTRYSNQKYESSISKYYDLVRLAGVGSTGQRP